MKINISTLWSYLYGGKIKRHSNTIKQALMDENKELRFKCCCSNLHNREYDHFLNNVHSDEKWNNLTRGKETYYLLPDEEPPDRSFKSKSISWKWCVSVQWHNHGGLHGWETGSGRLRCGLLYDRSACKEMSKNCKMGSVIMKQQSINPKVMEKMLTFDVFPAIIAKLPQGFPKTVRFQKDTKIARIWKQLSRRLIF